MRVVRNAEEPPLVALQLLGPAWRGAEVDAEDPGLRRFETVRVKALVDGVHRIEADDVRERLRGPQHVVLDVHEVVVVRPLARHAGE